MTGDNNSMFELTLEQQFSYRQMQETVQCMTPEQMAEMLLASAKLLMIKDNIIRNLTREALSGGNASILR